MTAIAADLNRANRSLNAVRIPGQSNTAQDLIKQFKKSEGATGHGSLLTQALLAAGAGFEAHGVTGALSGVGLVLGKHYILGARARGLEQVGDIVKEAMLNPEVARRLLAKVAPGPEAAMPTSKLLLRSGAVTPQQQSEQRAPQ